MDSMSSPTCCPSRNWKTSPTPTNAWQASRSTRSMPSRRSCRTRNADAVSAVITQPMRDHLAHHVRQRFVLQRRDRYPAHALGRAGSRGNAGDVNDKLQREMREHMVHHAGLAMPARYGFQRRRLFRERLVVVAREPFRGRHLCHAAEQTFFGSRANQKFASPRDDERRTTPQRASFLWSLARERLLIATHARGAIVVERT